MPFQQRRLPFSRDERNDVLTHLLSVQEVQAIGKQKKISCTGSWAEGYKYTLSSSTEGLMPKKGLMAMPGRISSPGLEGRGEIQMPPVSEGKKTTEETSVTHIKAREREKPDSTVWTSAFALDLSVPCQL